MGQQRGTYYWDDDSLSPGNRSDGGWSQNLFDDDGNLRGHARFVPDPNSDDDQYTYSPYDEPPMFMSSETRWESDNEYDAEAGDDAADQLAEALILLIGAAAIAGITYAAPRIKSWTEETALPFIKGTLSKVRVPWGKKRDQESASDETVDGIVVSDEPFEAIEQSDGHTTPEPLQIEAKRQKMSNAEAQARLVAAAAAQLFAEEQTRLVMRADVVNATDVDDLRRQLATHPHDKLEEILQHLARNPRLLEDGSLAQLASILGRNSLGLGPAHKEHAPLPRVEEADTDDSGSEA